MSLRYIKEAISILEGDAGDNAERLADFYDTLGFVQIVFGENPLIIREGIKNCEEGRRSGADENLYFKHLHIANGRLKELDG